MSPIGPELGLMIAVTSAPPNATVARAFRTPHNLHDVAPGACTSGSTLAHYSLTASAKRLALRKAQWELEMSALPNRTEQGQFVCTLSDARGACHDYEGLLTFMGAQEREPNRSVAPLCMTSPVGSTSSRYALE